MVARQRNTITDISGLKIGNAHDVNAKTGVTIILPEKPAIAAVNVAGGGPGTRETDALRLEGLVDRVDAIVLAGGSVYGLAAADRVTSLLGAAGKGFSLVPLDGVPVSPIVPSAILYDLSNGGDKDWGDEPPYQRLADNAFHALSAELVQGKSGAGYGAQAGAYPGGLGSVSASIGEAFVGAVAAVNSFGSPYVAGTDQFWAAPWEQGAEFGARGVAPTTGVQGFPPDTKIGADARSNTTIAVVATDISLTKAQCARVAAMAQNGLARALRPAHGPTDGDTVFVMSTGEKPLPGPETLGLTMVGNVAADVLARAIARGVYEAEAAN